MTTRVGDGGAPAVALGSTVDPAPAAAAHRSTEGPSPPNDGVHTGPVDLPPGEAAAPKADSDAYSPEVQKLLDDARSAFMHEMFFSLMSQK